MLTREEYRKDALAFLWENTTAVIATSFNDEPKASTVYFWVDNEFTFYFVTKRNTSKYINIEMNPRAAIVVGTGPEHITVQAHGNAEIITDDEDRQEILDILTNIRTKENIQIWPIEEMEKFKDRNYVVFKIIPDNVTFMNLDSSKHPNSITTDYVEVFPIA